MPKFFLILSFFLITGAAFSTPLPEKKPTLPKKNLKQTHIFNFRPSTSTLPLNTLDTEFYREIYHLQANGKFSEADTLIKKIDNTVLIGHVYAHRLLYTPYQANQDDYKRWLKTYPDHPQSITIKKRVTGAAQYKNRITGTLPELRYFANGSKYLSNKYKGAQLQTVNQVKKEVANRLNNGAASSALSYFNDSPIQSYIDPVDKSQILSKIASVYLYLGHAEKARITALKALKASKDTPTSGWILGLTAWINKDYAESAKYFTLASKARYASPWMTSAASYWGARASTRAGLYKDVSPLLARAVKNQRTFYGLIATKALGYGYDFNWTMPAYTPKTQNILQQYPAGGRAIALAEIGQMNMAESELYALPVKDHPELASAAIALAHHYNLAGYAMRFSSAMANPAGGYYDAGLYPVSTWTTSLKNEDVALLNAFIRQESRFISSARNPTGATGLMQIMPNTAAFVTGDDVYKSIKGQRQLQNPHTNTQIGASYLHHLRDLDAVDNDLFGMAIAYNAGPGKLSRWKRELKIKDPLLFIELIPSSETRAFVERIATNYWIYQMRLGFEPKTLMDVAQGDWPRLD